MNLYPLKFKPIIKDKIWGGSKLKELLNKDINSTKAGESWEISAVEGNISEVTNGFLAENDLQELVEIYMGELVGDSVYEKYGNEFPLLIKFIDASDVLSIQVHPNDELSKERHKAYGKTEMWYVLQADNGAELISGFNQEMDKDKYLTYFENKNLPEILNSEKVDSGDVYYIPAGRVHAIGKGILLAEIQQTSDVTYRIFDWNRKDAEGKERELHTDLAVDAIDYSYHKKYKSSYDIKENRSSEVVRSPYFTTNIIELTNETEFDYFDIDSFVIYMCLEGEFVVNYEDDKGEKVAKGECVLLPAVIENVRLIPKSKSKILEIYIK